FFYKYIRFKNKISVTDEPRDVQVPIGGLGLDELIQVISEGLIIVNDDRVFLRRIEIFGFVQDALNGLAIAGFPGMQLIGVPVVFPFRMHIRQRKKGFEVAGSKKII